MTLAELMAALKDAQDSAEFYGIKPEEVQVSVRDETGREYSLKDVYALVRTLHAVLIQIDS